MNKKKIALITGANKGIGLETARQLGGKTLQSCSERVISQKGKLPQKGCVKMGSTLIRL